MNFSSLFFPQDFYDADPPSGSPPPDTGGNPDTQDKKDKGGDDGGEKEKPKEQKTFTQEDLDRIVAERLERDRKKREQDAKKSQDDIEAKNLAEQKKWEELATKREKTISELQTQLGEAESYKEKSELYEKALKGFLTTEREGLPEHILTLLDKLNVVDQLDYIAKNRNTLKGSKKPGPNPTPDPADDKALSEAQKQEASKSATQSYRHLWG